MSNNTKLRAMTHKETVTDFKYKLIRDAAKSVFATRGIQATTVREIAKSASCTTGTIYSLYDSKEDLYADVLRDSMKALFERLSEIRTDAPEHRQGAQVLGGLLDFYLERPEDYDLSFYLYGGARPVGLRPDLNKELNRQAADIIALIADVFAADGVADKERAPALALSALSQVFGIVLLAKTGRLKSWHQSPQTLLEAYLSLLYTANSAPKQGKSVRRKRSLS